MRKASTGIVQCGSERGATASPRRRICKVRYPLASRSVWHVRLSSKVDQPVLGDPGRAYAPALRSRSYSTEASAISTTSRMSAGPGSREEKGRHYALPDSSRVHAAHHLCGCRVYFQSPETCRSTTKAAGLPSGSKSKDRPSVPLNELLEWGMRRTFSPSNPLRYSVPSSS